MNHCVRISGLTKRYGSLVAVDNLDLDIPANCIYGVIGPNGAGKTTLFSLLAGFLKPDGGTMQILDETDLAKVRGRFTILPQDARFQSGIPIMDQLLFFLRISGWTIQDARKEIARVLELVDFSDLLDRSSATLSHGQYKRLCLAQAFLGNPSLVILDEPTTGLDIVSARGIRDYVRKLKGNASVIISSHDMQEMQDLCDEVCLMEKGHLDRTGKVRDLMRNLRALTFTVGRDLDSQDLTAIRGIAGLASIEATGTPATYRVCFAEGPDGEHEARVQELLRVLTERKATLRNLTEENVLERLYLDTVRKDR